MDQELSEINDRTNGNSSNWETVIAARANVMVNSNTKSNGLALKKEATVEEAGNADGEICPSSIDNDLVEENQRVCRICHLTVKESGGSSVDLVKLGCRCRGDLGAAHVQCAETWFRLKGNRLCELCGEAAKSITGVGDEGFLEEWNDRGSSESRHSSTSDGSSRPRLGRQPMCNLLLAFLVIAFVLPLFFRVNLL